MHLSQNPAPPLSYALKPAGNETDVVAMYVRWPSYGSLRHPRSTPNQQSMLANRLVSRLVSNAAAQSVLLAVAEGTSEQRINATIAALKQENCVVEYAAAHTDGALGLMRDWLGIDPGPDTHGQRAGAQPPFS